MQKRTVFQIVMICLIGNQIMRPVVAEEMQTYLGLGLIAQSSILKGESSEVDPVPLLGWEKGRWSLSTLDGLNFRFKETRQSSWALNLEHVDMDVSSDNRVLKSLDPPDASIPLSLVYQRDFAFSYVRAALGRDVIGRHDGLQLSASIGAEVPFKEGELSLDVSIQYLTSDWVNYFYAVSAAEANQMIAAYQGDDSVNFQATLVYEYPINSRWLWLNGATHTQYGKEITRSSIVDSDSSSAVFSGMVYRF